MFCGMELQHVFECCLSALTQHHNRLVTRLLHCRCNTLFEVGPEIHCSGVSSHYCCYGNHTLVLSQFKNFIVVNGELNKVSLCQK